MSAGREPEELLLIKAAAVRWINAEFAFRCGPRAYDSQTMTWLVEAEDGLRKAVTGKRYLKNARKILDERKGTGLLDSPEKPLK